MIRDQRYNTNPVNGGDRQAVQQYKRDSNSIGYGGFAAATQTKPETVVPNDRGRTKYTKDPTSEYAFKPMRRPLQPARCGADPAPPEGKMYISAPKLPEQVRAERVHSDQFNRLTTQEILLSAKMQAKTQVADPTGISVGRRPAIEAPIEKYFQTKSRITDFSKLRAGIEQATPGDKAYAAVEYSPGYFYQSGVVPGANVGTYGPKSGQGRHMFLPPPGFKKRQERRLGKKMREAGKAISATESVLTYERLSYEAKRNARILAEEMDGVRGLTETDEDIFNELCALHYKSKNPRQILKKKDRERLYGSYDAPLNQGQNIKEQQQVDDLGEGGDPEDEDSDDEDESPGVRDGSSDDPNLPGQEDHRLTATHGGDIIGVAQYGGYSAGIGDVNGNFASECLTQADRFRKSAKGGRKAPSWEDRTGLKTWESKSKKEPTPRADEEEEDI